MTRVLLLSVSLLLILRAFLGHAGEFHGTCSTPVIGGYIPAGGSLITKCNITGAKPGYSIFASAREYPGDDVILTACILPKGDVLVALLAMRSTDALPTAFDVQVVDYGPTLGSSACSPLGKP